MLRRSVGMIKFWVREEAAYANKWGMDRHELGGGLTEPLNPSFHGVSLCDFVQDLRLLLFWGAHPHTHAPHFRGVPYPPSFVVSLWPPDPLVI